MAQTKHEIQALLSEAASQPKHRFGQNFMIDGNLVRLVADSAGISPGDRVIEVGPGTGTLTEELLLRGAEVLALEIDRNLAELLRSRFASKKNFRVVAEDALASKHELNAELIAFIAEGQDQKKMVRLVANLPYNIASPLIVELLIAGADSLLFTVQREVADRLGGVPRTKEYGPLSIVTQLLATVEILRSMPPQAFWPMPKVESALVRLVRQDRLGESAAEFSRFVHKVFSARRKMLRSALQLVDNDADGLLAACGISGRIRAEELAPEDCLRLFQKSRNRG
jgi:16S rRNA (adenine1518-N6/adenine1519-N6)-dimethyltransferase